MRRCRRARGSLPVLRTVGLRPGSRWPGIACLALALSASACRASDRDGAQTETLTVAYCCDEWLMSPNWQMPAMHMLFLPLTVRNANDDLEGRLARSWEHSSDYRSWTVHLRTDVRWHDGAPVTAHDVAFTLDLLTHPAVLHYPPDAYSVAVLDDSTYTIEYRKVGPGSPLDTYSVYYPRHLLEGLDPQEFARWEYWTRPVGNGPFRYVRHEPGVGMELEANPDFYAGEPAIRRVVIKFVPGAPLVTDLLSGEVDLAPMMNRMDVLTLGEDPRFQVHATPYPHRGKGIFWNHRRPPFDEARVRRAITLAIDRPELLRALSLPDETPLFDVIFTARQFRQGQLPPPLEADSAGAARLLAEAGWRDHDGDGIRDRGGTPFRFTALVPAGAESDELAVLVQARLRRFGIAMEIRPLDGDAVRRRRIAGDFDAVFGNHLMDAPGQGSPSAEWFGHESASGYENLSVAARLDSLAAALDPAEADRLHRVMWPDFQRDLPVTFLQPVVSWTVSRQRVRGLGRPHVLDPMSAVEMLWIEEDSN